MEMLDWLFFLGAEQSNEDAHDGKGNEITLPVSEIGGAGVYFIKSNSVVKKLVVK